MDWFQPFAQGYRPQASQNWASILLIFHGIALLSLFFSNLSNIFLTSLISALIGHGYLQWHRALQPPCWRLELRQGQWIFCENRLEHPLASPRIGFRNSFLMCICWRQGKSWHCKTIFADQFSPEAWQAFCLALTLGRENARN